MTSHDEGGVTREAASRARARRHPRGHGRRDPGARRPEPLLPAAGAQADPRRRRVGPRGGGPGSRPSSARSVSPAARAPRVGTAGPDDRADRCGDHAPPRRRGRSHTARGPGSTGTGDRTGRGGLPLAAPWVCGRAREGAPPARWRGAPSIARPVVAELAPRIAAADPGRAHGLRPETPVIQVTGTNGKTTTVRLLAHLVIRRAERRVLLDGRRVPRRRLVRRGDYSGFGGAATALAGARRRRAGDRPRGELLRGIGVLHNDVAVVTNVSADHLGLHGIDTVDSSPR